MTYYVVRFKLEYKKKVLLEFICMPVRPDMRLQQGLTVVKHARKSPKAE